MKPLVLHCLLAALLGVALPAAAGDASVAATAARAQYPAMVEWRRDFHRHPELGGHETRTAAAIARELRALGLEPRTGIARTGVAAVLRGGRPGPRIATREDMEALPLRD